MAASEASRVRTMSDDIVIVVNDDNGIDTITGQDVRILSLGKLQRVEYDDACSYIQTILESNLDGPAQMGWIRRIATQFLTDNDIPVVDWD